LKDLKHSQEDIAYNVSKVAWGEHSIAMLEGKLSTEGQHLQEQQELHRLHNYFLPAVKRRLERAIFDKSNYLDEVAKCLTLLRPALRAMKEDMAAEQLVYAGKMMRLYGRRELLHESIENWKKQFPEKADDFMTYMPLKTRRMLTDPDYEHSDSDNELY